MMNTQIPKGIMITACKAVNADWIIELTNPRSDNAPTYAVRNMGKCLNKRGAWEHEPLPSSRTDEFLERCRWSDWDQLIEFLKAKGML